ncbi:MBL fold metallo-hydrolase [Cellulomonas aerilata]|uniref:MBL fold metallo-hydrolase n=1 Tax=Cellulomonas aerilata TaxID=515326 RepID=A0A512DAI8_9CELL|nr:MBL fold metallo-hydrolase [Cellulomonas aerilata]GEO33465.1 MBL fold metallo-hydrolase [Cellulomonas aerilata]
MDLTLLGHACVRLDKDGSRLVIDPGAFSATEALEGADAVLITHEHVDHVVPDELRAALVGRPDLAVWAPEGVAAAIVGDDDSLADRVHAAAPGDHVDVAGFAVDVVGGTHAVIHPDVPQAANVGYLVDGVLLHPGDSFTLPDAEVDVLLVPVAGPWMKVAEAIDYVRAAAARRAVPIHDAIYTDGGKGLVDRLLGPQGPGTGGTEYVRPQPGETVTVG